MNKKFVILNILQVILVFLCFSSLDLDFILEFFETNFDSFSDIYYFGFLSAFLYLSLLYFVLELFSLIFRKIRKSLEKQGKE